MHSAELCQARTVQQQQPPLGTHTKAMQAGLLAVLQNQFGGQTSLCLHKFFSVSSVQKTGIIRFAHAGFQSFKGKQEEAVLGALNGLHLFTKYLLETRMNYLV